MTTPWIRFFPSDWLGGTRALRPEESGIYMTLIMLMYEHGSPIKENLDRLSLVCNTTVVVLKKTLEFLVSENKISRTDEGLWNEKVEKEIEYSSEKSEAARQRVNKRWTKKDNENNDGDDTDVSNQYNEPEPEPEPEYNNKNIFTNVNIQKDDFEKTKIINFPEKPKKPKKPPKQNTRIAYHGDFEMLWTKHPVGSKKVAYDAWMKLPNEDRTPCFDGVLLYKADIENHEKYARLKRTPPIPAHLSTFINQRRFDDWLEKEELQDENCKKIIKHVMLTRDHKLELEAWRDYYKSTGKKFLLTEIERTLDGCKPQASVPTRFPEKDIKNAS